MAAEREAHEFQTMSDTTSDEFTSLLVWLDVPKPKIKSTDPESFFGNIKEFVNVFLKQLDAIEKAEKQASQPAPSVKRVAYVTLLFMY